MLVTREAEDGFAARFLCQVGFIDFRGARDPDNSRRLAAALAQDWGRAVQSLRRDHHVKAGRVGCIARAGVSRVVCPQSRGLRRHELRRPSAGHDSPSRRGVSKPAIVAAYGEKAGMRSLEFFAPKIRNPDFP